MDNRVFAPGTCDADLLVWNGFEFGDHDAPNLHFLK